MEPSEVDDELLMQALENEKKTDEQWHAGRASDSTWW